MPCTIGFLYFDGACFCDNALARVERVDLFAHNKTDDTLQFDNITI